MSTATTKPSAKTRYNYRSWLWLALGAGTLMFANGGWIIPLAAWLMPVFMIRFIRSQKAPLGLLAAGLTRVAVGLVTWHGLIPAPGWLYFPVTALFMVISFLPFLIDRLLTPRVNGLRSTLIFPMAWVAMEYLNSLTNPFGTWGALAYTQFGHLPLMQIVSVTGIWGITFLIAWSAAVVNWIWEHGGSWPAVRKAARLCCAVVILVLLLGGARLALYPPKSTTVRIGSITISTRNLARAVIHTPSQSESLRQKMIERQNDLMKLSRQAAKAGAQIVFWQENAAPIFKEDEASLIDRGRKLAKSEGIYLLMALSVRPPEYPGGLIENKLIWLDPSGRLSLEYLKARPAPGEGVVRGDGNIPVIETPYGKVAAVICFDMDIPGLIRRAGREEVDLMLAPSADWPEITPLHTHMAAFRAVENGFSMVRAAAGGLSAAVDYQGRILAALDFRTTTDRIMISDVPTKGAKTLYARTADWFAWICLAGLPILGWSARKRN